MRVLTIMMLVLATALAGCTDDEGQPLAAAEVADVQTAAQTLLEVPLQWEGEMRAGATACAVIVCVNGYPNGYDWYEFRIDGDGQRLAVNLSWEPTTPANQELNLGFFEKKSDHWEWIDGVGGSSPISFESSALGENKSYILLAYKPIVNPVAYVELDTPQPVAIEGIATTLQTDAEETAEAGSKAAE